jgi:hypothetical protein
VSQATLPGLPASVGCTRDPLERHYTPPDLAEACCGWLAEITALGEGPRVVEPSCGGGAFARAIRKTWPLAHLTGIDIDDQAAGLRHCDAALIGDWLDLGVGARADAVIGNPPFSTAIPHVERGLAVLDGDPARRARPGRGREGRRGRRDDPSVGLRRRWQVASAARAASAGLAPAHRWPALACFDA